MTESMKLKKKLATGIVESINNYEPTLYYKKTKDFKTNKW